MALTSLLINTVSIVKYGSPVNVLGNNVPTSTTTTGISCSVQQTSAAARFEQDIEGATTSGKAFFAADPGVKTGDLIIWGSRTLECQSPASDEAGRGVLFSINWRETL